MKGHVTILGSFVVDLMARSPHIPKPGETVKGHFFRMGPGGKGSNQAVAAHRSGADVTLITKVGNDLFGNVARDFYRSEGIDDRYVFVDETLETGIALIMVDEITSQNSITVVSGACEAITMDEITQVYHALDNTDVLLCQLETNTDIFESAITRVQANGGIAILNPAPAPSFTLSDKFLGMFNILTPNETEASVLTGIEVTDIPSAHKAALALQAKGIDHVVITLGNTGSFLLTKNQEAFHFPVLDVNVVDTTGAGDAFNGGLATSLSKGKPIQEAMVFASAVAALSVTKIGTAPAMPYSEEIDAILNSIETNLYWNRVQKIN